MESRHWFAIIFSLLAIAWASLLVLLVPQAVCDMAFNTLRAEFQSPHTDDEGRRLAGQYCTRFGSAIQSSVALAVAPAVVINGVCAIMLVAVGRRARSADSPPVAARDA
jgi:hypothetical protein